MDSIIEKELSESSNDNVLFVTEQCNNRCLMCCQPPKCVDDIDALFSLNVSKIKKSPKNIKTIAITGGEPTLLGNRLLELLILIREELPNTIVHILTNGRLFSDAEFTKRVVEAGDGMISFGIPLHSDYERDHNIIAGNSNAFTETIYGLYNLAMNSAVIELRIVVNKMNYMRLSQISHYVHKNLSFVTWISFMGMERIGYADSMSDSIWIEPVSYISGLVESCDYLSMAGYDVRIYNIPLCLLPRTAHHYSCKSISEWKTFFLPQCQSCSMIEKCCGNFSTSSEPFHGIKPILDLK